MAKCSSDDKKSPPLFFLAFFGSDRQEMTNRGYRLAPPCSNFYYFPPTWHDGGKKSERHTLYSTAVEEMQFTPVSRNFSTLFVSYLHHFLFRKVHLTYKLHNPSYKSIRIGIPLVKKKCSLAIHSTSSNTYKTHTSKITRVKSHHQAKNRLFRGDTLELLARTYIETIMLLRHSQKTAGNRIYDFA